MASAFVAAAAGEEIEMEIEISAQAPPPPPPPLRDLRRSWSTNSAASAAGKCVCAPATHARSFKCRLHRVRSDGRSSPQSPPPPPTTSSSSTRTVEAP